MHKGATMLGTTVTESSRLSTKLLVFAIMFEGLAVTAGLALAIGSLYEAIEGIPELTPALLLNAALGALPFVLVAITEATKIPLTLGFFNSASLAWRLIIGLMLIAIAGITFETAATGFERAYTVRAIKVETLQQELAGIDRSIADVSSRVAALTARRAELVGQLEKIDAQEAHEIDQHTERCKAVGSSCNSKPYIEEIRRSAEAKRGPVQMEIASVDAELGGLSTTSLVAQRATKLSALAAEANNNQIYRFAARMYGKPVEQLSVAEAAFVGKVWFGSIGIIVAITGIVLAGTAALLSRPRRSASRVSQTLRRAILSLRKRARVEVVRKVEIPGPERIVEKIVEVPQERKIIVYVPKGFEPEELKNADVEARIEAYMTPKGRVELRQVGGRA